MEVLAENCSMMAFVYFVYQTTSSMQQGCFIFNELLLFAFNLYKLARMMTDDIFFFSDY